MSSVLSPVKPSATHTLPIVDGDAPYPAASSSSTSTAATLSPAPRPNFVRRETDQILSYYQSEHAGRPFDYATAAAEHGHGSSSTTTDTTTTTTTAHARKLSTFSSASEYSDNDRDDHAFPERAHPKAASATASVSFGSRSSSSTTTAPHLRKPSTVSRASEYSSGDDRDLRSVQSEREHRLESTSVSSESQLPTPVRANVAIPPPADSARADGVARHSRRPSVPTEGGADRRRVAIVEMDSTAPLNLGRKRSRGLDARSSSSHDPNTSSSSSSMSTTTGTTLSSRRGVHIGGLALVAPPDASPKTYTNLTPPSTAPVVADRASQPPPPSGSSHYHHAHARSASEAVTGSSSTSASHAHAIAAAANNAAGSGRSRHLHHKSSRDVGIVGLALSSASTASDSLGPASPKSDIDDYQHYHAYVHQHEGLGVPVFQTPAKSRSPSPGSGGGATPDLSDTSSASAHHRSPVQRLLSTPIFGMEDGIVTPGIGEYKDIQQPVVGPVIVGLSPEFMQRTQMQQQQQPPPQRRPDPSAASQQNVFPTQQPPPSVQSPTSTSPSYQSSSASSPYLHYKPGVHATAGPLPPPPRSLFDPPSTSSSTTGPPPRPPRFHTPVPPGSGARREIEAIKEKLQLPQSVSAALAARTPPAEADKDKRLGHSNPNPSPARSESRGSEESAYSDEDNNNNQSSVKLVPSSSVHRREGAFPPSKIFTSPPGQQLVESPRGSEEVSSTSRAEGRPVVVIEEEHEEEPRKAAEVERSSPADGEPSASQGERKDPERRIGLELRRESSWVSLRQELANNAQRHSSPNGKAAGLPNVTVSISRSASFVSGTSSSSSSSGSSRLPIPPPKNTKGGSDDEKQQGLGTLAPSSFRATLTNLKRFSSLPRTPSRSSRSSKHSTSPSPTPDPRRSFSPPPQHVVPIRRVIPRPTLVSSWPPAMNTRDITILRSPRERAKAYAEKINELAMYDCGLREWMATQSMGRPGSHPRTQSQRTARDTLQPAVPAEFGGQTPQGRHVSHGSLASEATFPIRADAYTATDLSLRPIDSIAPSTAPPPLPYPALAQANVTRTATRTSILSSSPTKTLAILPGSKATGGGGTGFFASLGRKTSTRKEKGLSMLSSSPQSPSKVLTKRPPGIAASKSNPQSSTSARDAPLPTVPAIPGGPRAAPGKIQRSKTYSVSASPPQHVEPQTETETEGAPRTGRQSVMARRPSLFSRARGGHASVAPAPASTMPPPGSAAAAASAAALTMADPAFQQQVDKLAAILPHADRAILAGYLRRAGEDILAIGQYLEDEKNGTLRRD
ncbi:hypothetical protein FKP32DRAFT_1592440 [Trametes sanguinea]|nr:hypothetical protein FKP32DRAFT_1592440 [Trametes sanguinea]